MRAVIKIGGFIFPAELDAEKIKRYSNLVGKLHRQGNQLVIVTGGGQNARRYIEAARKLGTSEAICDEIGIEVSRLNARLLISALQDDAYPEVPVTTEELKRYISSGRVVVMGGLQPGHSTNAVAAVAAEIMRADVLVNATDVDGVYSEDPRKNPNAKKLEHVSVKSLSEMLSKGRIWAGEYELIDPVAIKIIQRSTIPTWIVSGKDLSNIEKAMRGMKIGTRVTFE